jgi:fucose 4-O-acetylase-like acetyltransferase
MVGRKTGPSSLAEMAAATPQDRDRYVDFLRALSILVVVFGHWLMAIVYWRGEGLTGASALEVVPGLWILTWILQVMPLFFFVGGFSNLVALDAVRRRGGGYSEFVSSRLQRLMRPTAIFIAAWLAIACVLEYGLGLGDAVTEATAILAKPLWFLAVYAIVIAVAPAMLNLHRRYGLLVPIAMAGAAAAIDVARIAFDIPVVGYLNFAFVWLFPHQMGFFYADGSFARWGRRVHALFATGGLVALAGLVASGIYSPSMVGMNTDKVSNNDPPTICLIALGSWLVGLAMLLRPRLNRWLARPRTWTAVIAVNSMIMTVFLWHLTALLLLVVIAYPLGFPQFAGGSAAWWATRPLWLAMLCASLAPFVALFGRFERAGFGRRSASAPSRRRVVIGTALLVAGMAGFAEAGFAGITSLAGRTDVFAASPVLNAVLAGGGTALVRGGRR